MPRYLRPVSAVRATPDNLDPRPDPDPGPGPGPDSSPNPSPNQVRTHLGQPAAAGLLVVRDLPISAPAAAGTARRVPQGSNARLADPRAGLRLRTLLRFALHRPSVRDRACPHRRPRHPRPRLKGRHLRASAVSNPGPDPNPSRKPDPGPTPCPNPRRAQCGSVAGAAAGGGAESGACHRVHLQQG